MMGNLSTANKRNWAATLVACTIASILYSGEASTASMASTASTNTTVAIPPSLQQLCGITSPPPPSSSIASILGPVKYANISTGRLAYIRFGNASSSRPPILFILGFGGTLQDLPTDIALKLAKNQEFIAFDNRGQGLSVEYNTSETLTIQGMANDTMELINALNLTKPTVFGFSMGGMIATDLVAEHGPSLGLVIVASGSAGGPQSIPPTEQATAVLINRNSTEIQFLNLSFDLSNPHSRKAACQTYLNTFSGIRSPHNSTTTGRGIGAIARWFISQGVVNKLAAIQNPVMLIAGLTDPIVPPQNSRLMAEKIPRVSMSILPGRHRAFDEWGNFFVDEFEAFYEVYGS